MVVQSSGKRSFSKKEESHQTPKELQMKIQSAQIPMIQAWIVEEPMKSREMMKRFVAKLEEVWSESPEMMDLDASELDSIDQFWDEASALSLFSKRKVIRVRRAEHLAIQDIKDHSWLDQKYWKDLKQELVKNDLNLAVVLQFEKWDPRKRFQKWIAEHSKPTLFDAVEEGDREAWLDYLLERHQQSRKNAQLAPLNLSSEQRASLLGMDPWTLDRLEIELSLIQLEPTWGREIESEGLDSQSFVDEILYRKPMRLKIAGPLIFKRTDFLFPLLGLLSWNLKNVFEAKSSTSAGGRGHQSGGGAWYQQKNKQFSQIAQLWSFDELAELTRAVVSLDHSIKGGPRSFYDAFSNLLRVSEVRVSEDKSL